MVFFFFLTHVTHSHAKIQSVLLLSPAPPSHTLCCLRVPLEPGACDCCCILPVNQNLCRRIPLQRCELVVLCRASLPSSANTNTEHPLLSSPRREQQQTQKKQHQQQQRRNSPTTPKPTTENRTRPTR